MVFYTPFTARGVFFLSESREFALNSRDLGVDLEVIY
jgi:hypothetical protein